MSLEANETGNLIGSDKVEGTAVYGADRNKIGSIERVMIDKTSGRVSYAVLSFGGFLGIGDDLDWTHSGRIGMSRASRYRSSGRPTAALPQGGADTATARTTHMTFLTPRASISS